MDYFVCTTCRHTTLDHEMYFPRACLLACTCQQMVNGPSFVKKAFKATEPRKKSVFSEAKEKRERLAEVQVPQGEKPLDQP